MIGFEKFKASTKIYEGQNGIFYRAVREADGTRVILKQLKGKYDDEDKLAILNGEIESTKKLEYDGIVKNLDIVGYLNEPTLVLEDFGGEVLENILNNGKVDINLFLKIAIKLTDIIEYIHISNMIHQNIMPDNIFVNIENGIVKITGIRNNIETTMDKQQHHEWAGNQYSAAYISPEQTGRIDQEIDYRTDFYSLGIVFYTMLTGTLPFKAKDYFEIIYSHLANEAIPVSQCNLDVPEALSNIISKLMQKKVENRYQTTAGLKWDLEECFKRLEFRDERYDIKAFTIGKRDAPEELYLSKKILGREDEIEKLFEAFETVRKSGIPKMIFVSGYSGIGKTTLVNEACSPIKKAGGSFIQGKYDQYKKNTPYSSLIQAFDTFFNDILVQGKDSVSRWKDKFTDALGENTQIITSIFPKMGKILGSAKHAEDLTFTEAQNRFKRTIIKFLRTVATKEHPLVIFLDDLQWADISSIKFLEFVFSGIEDIYILFIGAYRNTEVVQAHPLHILINKLSESDYNVSEIINLKPLKFEQVRELILESLHYSNEQTNILVRICYEKTEGNPFFLHQFIKFLKDEGIISYNNKGINWKINMEKMLDYSETKNIVDLIIQKLEKLSMQTVEVLKMAACINNTFEADTLSKIMGVSYKTVATSLKEALKEELIALQNVDSYIAYKSNTYCFLHDRVQQAVYSLVDEEQKINFHYIIGKQLMKNSQVFEECEFLFEITDHLNFAEDIITVKNEKLLLARLNLESGKRARSFSAYNRAMEYLSKGIETIGDECWISHYQLALELYTEATGTAYICGRYSLMEQFGDVVLTRSKEILDKAKIYEIKIECLTVQNRLEEAIETARKVLKLLGVTIPAKPTSLDIMAKYLKIRFTMIRYKFDDIRNMPEMTDEKQLTIMRILTSTGIAAYTFSERVMLMLILTIVDICLKHGIAPLTPVAYASYGHFLCAHLKKRELGYRFGKLAIDLQSSMKTKAYECKTNLTFEILVRHNKEHIANTLKGFPYNHQNGLNSGDLTSAGHVMMQHFVYMYLAGRELHSIQNQVEEYMGDLLKTGNRTSIAVCTMYLQGIENFLKSFEEPWKLRGKHFDEGEELSHYEYVNDRTVIFNTYFNKMLTSYMFGQYKEALKNLKKVEEYVDGAIGTYCIPVYNFYGALIHLELLSTYVGLINKYDHKRHIKEFLREIKSYCKDAPENNKNKYFLVKAEQARINRKYDQAIDYYKKSIKTAKENGFLQEEALANELAGKLLYSTGRSDDARSYIKAGIYCYSKWGSLVKVKQLQTVYKDLLSDKEIEKGLGEAAAAADFTSTQLLDVETIVRANQAISEEIVLQELLKKMILIVLQNAGARKALFIMETNGEMYIEAEGTADDKEVRIIKDAVKGNTEILEKLVNYVANTRESIILNSETEIEKFTGRNNSDIKEAKSLFCMPVESKRSLVGILYLENDLIDGAFTGKHMLVLKVLAAQLAISMENANLYQSMEKIVDERTSQLRSKNYELECANIRLENASRIKNEFLANMSHEMRTPLNGVIGMAGMLQKGDLTLEQEETVNSILCSARSLLEIINEILDFSKIEANRIDLEEHDFDLKQLVKELLSSFTLRAEEKGIELAWTVRQESVKVLRGDSLRIKQIITNLLSNAVKFTERGKVELKVMVVKKGERTAVIDIEVKDSGIGIPANKLDYIFQDFAQVDNSTSRKFGGTGLGLSITKKLVEMMNGTINVESTLGKGSTFRCKIELGLSDSRKDSYAFGKKASTQEFKNVLSNFKILVAEDNDISRKYIKALLEYLGCKVILVTNGLEVLEILDSYSFDCILMDKNMPKLDGIETTHIIREKEKYINKHIPIIALTASAILGDREKLLSEGMDYYLSKPINEKELVETLRAAKDGVLFYGQLGNINSSAGNGFVDKKVFFEEAELYGEEVMLEIITDFFTSYRDALQRIKTYINKPDYLSAEKEIHRFAGTISIFHCSSFVNMIKETEQAAANEDLISLKNGYLKLEERIVQFVKELEDVKMYLLNKKGL